MSKHEIESFYPAGIKQWRAWLQKHHASKQSVWLIGYKKSSGIPSLTWAEAVEEALCFGWIDSKRIPVDDEKYMQFFSKRKPKGTWSKINKDKVQQLIDEGRMAKAGLQCIEVAKKNGAWTILDEVEALTIPKDLERAFKTQRGAKEFFMGLSRTTKKAMLQWLVLAKQAETRQRRVNEIATLAAQGLKPKQF